jgi:penicillin-binding protein A
VNSPIRRISIAVIALFASLLAMVNYRQVVQAGDLRDDPRNGRVLLRTYAVDRGAIAVETGGKATPIADSVETDDALKYLRRYATGPQYAHVTGFSSYIYGSTGIERAQDRVLSGEDDRLFVERLSDQITGNEPEGGSVVLTLDPAAQAAAVAGLRGKRGAVVALDPRTGAVLAMVSAPSFDPAALSSHDGDAIRTTYGRLSDDPAQPLLNRAIRQTYPPGSTFKVITAAAALESGLTPDSRIPSPTQLTLPQTSRPLRNFGGGTCGDGRTTTLSDALRISCNTAFAQIGLDLDGDEVRDVARSFGFGDNDLEVPDNVVDSVYPDDLNAPQRAQSAIGQFDVRVTPLQMAMVAAGVGNGGRVMRPYLVKQVQAPDLRVLDVAEAEVYSEAVSSAVAAQLTAMMERVVTDGSARAAQISGVRVAGKTGTAQHAVGKDPHTWFIGFAPADDPQVAIAVIVEEGGDAGSEATGGRVSAPIARAVMQAVLR